MGIPEAYTNTHLDKFCLQQKPDPAYNIKYKLIAVQDPAVIELYEKKGTSDHEILGAPPSQNVRSNGVSSIQQWSASATINKTDTSNGQSSRNSSPLQNKTKLLQISDTTPKPTYPEPKKY
jgi:hypothetical protein